MATLVCAEMESGTLTRYETGGSAVRPTHRCTAGKRVTFTAGLIQGFRLNPPDEFRLDPPPRPTGPPSGVGTILKAA